PIFCSTACVKSEFPSSVRGTRIQRKRWEHGHINMILKDVPRLLFLAIARRNLGLLALTLDFAVPPLSLLVMFVFAIFVLSALFLLLGFSSMAFTISVACITIFTLAVFFAWLKCGRDVLPAGAVLSIVPYVIGKFGLYGQALTGRGEAQWNRTDR